MKIVRLVLLSCLVSFSASAEGPTITEEHKKEIQKLIKLSGVEDLMKPMMGQMISAFRKQPNNLPEEFWAGMEKKFDTSDLIKQLEPIYARHFEIADLKAMNAFYSTETGKRMVAKLPVVMQESMTIGQEWGRKLGMELAAEVKAATK
jgi:uncharacterized protein